MGIDTLSGFDRFMTYNLGASLGTTIYGTFRFGKKAKIQAIRHVMRPSVSYGYNPSFDQYYDYYISDAYGNSSQYTRFEGGDLRYAKFGRVTINRILTRKYL